MCGIAGFYHPDQNYLREENKKQEQLKTMIAVEKHRGGEDEGTYLSSQCGLSSTRLFLNGEAKGHQPFLHTINNQTFAIVYDGEIYNAKELIQEFQSAGYTFETSCDVEILLAGYLLHGPDFIKKINGVFAIAIFDPVKQAIILFRDRFGIKPLFFTMQEDELFFSSEMKGLFTIPSILPMLDRNGLNEIFSLGPATTNGSGVFKDIFEVLPSHMLYVTKHVCNQSSYWSLQSQPHEDDYDTTVEKTRDLIEDAVYRQMKGTTPISTLLSGGVDSSLVSSICANFLKKENKTLDTFSFDFKDNDKNFKSNTFQPSLDLPYVKQMVQYLDSNHTFLICDSQTQIRKLYNSVDARDLPTMADVDSSLLYFCSLVKKQSNITLTGECADEVFGGYPWFHKEEYLNADTFPWTMDLSPRKALLNDAFIRYLNMEDYVKEAYITSIEKTPRLIGETPLEARRREVSYLNLTWFMQTLIERMDRTSTHSSLVARVPFADYRLVEYIFNVPWDIKAKNGEVKHLLRAAGKGLLPDDVLFRKKSPYPKTYDTHYEALLIKQVKEILEDTTSPIHIFLDKKKVNAFFLEPSDYGKPWYGQLMARPQMLAYIIQINYWLKKYQISISL